MCVYVCVCVCVFMEFHFWLPKFGALRATVINVGNGIDDPSSNLDKTDFVSLFINALGKGVNVYVYPTTTINYG